MNSTKLSNLNDWLQVIAGFGVLVGLLLVFFELRQDNSIAYAERISELNDQWAEANRFKYENETLVLMKKAVEEPGKLSDTDIAQLDAFLKMMWSIYMSQSAVGQLGLVKYDISVIAPDLAWYCDSRFGRAWIEANRYWLSEAPDLLTAVVAELEASPISNEFQYMRDLKALPE